jgi:hypothetical protein
MRRLQMGKFIPMETPGGVIWVESEESVDGTLLVTAHRNKAFRSFQDAVNALEANAQFLQSTLQELAPSSIEISYGIKAGVENNAPLFGLSNNIDAAHYNVRLKWEETSE